MKNHNFNGLSLFSIIGLIAVSFILLTGFTHAKSGAQAESVTVLLSDDFSGSLSANWTTGTNSNQNSGGPSVAIVDGQVSFSQQYDYIETRDSFSNDFVITFDVSRKAGSHQCADYYIELVSVGAPAGIMRFRYGLDAKESINIGTPPTLNTAKNWDCIRDPNHLRELDHNGVSEGKIKFEYKDSKIQMSFTNDEGNTVTTSWVPVSEFNETKVRIWGVGGKNSQRYVDNFVITTDVAIAVEPEPGTNNDTPSDGDVIVLKNNFSGSLSDNWTTGTNSHQNSGGPTVSIVDGQVSFSQLYDYIETKYSFDGDLEISFDVIRKAGSHQCADYYVELVSVRAPAGIMRFRYGLDAKESINVGTPPTLNTAKNWDCIRDPNYLRELDHKGVSEGRITFTYAKKKVQMSFTNDEGKTITTSWVSAGSFDKTKVRIWGVGSRGSERYIDNVVITKLK
ncbi:hypothetical protein J7L05_04225 [bacterium]|nr:hypothetical protein [bacterium]